MRMVRGVGNLVEYLKSINCPLSEATLYRLVRTSDIPFSRPAPRVLIFDLNKIDVWLGEQA